MDIRYISVFVLDVETAVEHWVLFQKYKAVDYERGCSLSKRVGNIRYLLETAKSTHLHKCFINHIYRLCLLILGVIFVFLLVV